MIIYCFQVKDPSLYSQGITHWYSLPQIFTFQTGLFGFYPCLCTCICSFLSRRSISSVVDGNFSTSKSIISGVPHCSVLSPTIFLLLFLLLSIIFILMLMTPLCITPLFLNRTPTEQEVYHSIIESARRVTSDLAIISDSILILGIEGTFSASKTHFLHLST